MKEVHQLPLRNPKPDFWELRKVIMGEKKASRVHFVELGIDEEVMQAITECFMGTKWISEREVFRENSLTSDWALLERYLKQRIQFFYRTGYDYVPDGVALHYFLLRCPKPRKAADTAILSRGVRSWAEEGKGLITSWEDFERFPWEELELSRTELEDYYELMSKNLPEGMKISVTHSLYEQVMEILLGYEGLFYFIYDDPALVRAVIDRWGQIVYRFYENVVSLESVGVIFHADDLGHKTGLLVSPGILRDFVFPWFKKYSLLAHRNGKMYWYHSCGNISEVVEDLLEDVRIDALHSFQDIIIPVTDFKKKYGNRIGVLGGVDVDKLCRLDEEDLRKYVRMILAECMPCRYALGSGNSITNYMPIRNYLIMLEEGLKWGK